MALSTILYKKTPGSIGALTLDVTISVNHQFNSKVTQYSIETGGNVSDHIVNDPVVLNMVGFITNSPIKIVEGVLERVTSNRITIPNRVQSAFTLLTDMREVKETFTVVTGLKVYHLMFFKSLSFPRNNGTGDTLRFTAVLTRIIQATSRKVVVQNLDPGTTEAKEGTKDLAAEKVDKGAQTVTESTEEETTRVSILKQIVTGIF
ncbi:hypothetical protein KAR91_48740 [Candidatus Pacearchaeota archaeon]|nr:hypothetical protein [Candidatus Pacearchaeota archaeon]